MLNLTDRAGVTAALTDPTLDPDLRALLGLRAWQLDDDRSRPLGETVQFVVIQPGDTAEEIHQAVGAPICWDLADENLGWEWMEDHGHVFEIAYILTDDLGVLVFVVDDPGVDHTLRFNLLAVADRPSLDANRQ